LLQLLAGLAGGVAALLVSRAGEAAGTWNRINGLFAPGRNAVSTVRFADHNLDSQKPQRQAEILLERAIARSAASADRGAEESGSEVENQIEAHIPGWRGKLQLDSQLGQLTTAALNSSDRSVQASAIEVQLAAYGLAKNSSTVDMLVRQAGSQDHARKVWALWTLGLLGNRGIETDRVVEVLSDHLKASGNTPNRNDEDTRRWAVEGLGLVGTTSTIVPLLAAMHDDSSAVVRERAACSLAESGTLTHQQRLAAVPQLINYSEDPALDAQTHGWAFQALGDITKQRLPNDSAAWREWYRNSGSHEQ